MGQYGYSVNQITKEKYDFVFNYADKIKKNIENVEYDINHNEKSFRPAHTMAARSVLDKRYSPQMVVTIYKTKYTIENDLTKKRKKERKERKYKNKQTEDEPLYSRGIILRNLPISETLVIHLRRTPQR